jgi:hypothetical protein
MITKQADFLPIIDEAGTRAAVNAFITGDTKPAAAPKRRAGGR